MKKIVPIILTGCVLLSGCDNAHTATADAPGIKAAALPLIQDAIAHQVPSFDGHWDANIMAQVCRLASGEQDSQAFSGWFIQHGVDVNALAASDAGFGFIAKINEASAKVACAAWLVSSQLSPLEAWGSAVDSDEKLNSKMAPMTPLVSQTVELLSRMASATTQKTQPSEQDYRQAVVAAFTQQAPGYIQATLKGRFVPGDYLRPGSQNGLYRYRLQNGQTEVYFNGVTWLGAGKIKGELYTVTLAAGSAQQ
ncbi:hypothetical protein TUM12370_16120 [Salmonella enterica subsp. enterica serovar Choleraesuis]|nr:hypothetical protein TUM12370_16120 [Salmonella enterica subsp. enterica serovar Choleraesuis]